MSTTRIETKTIEFLNGTISNYTLEQLAKRDYKPRTSGGPASTNEIHSYLNKALRHGTTSSELSGMLTGSKEIVKVGYVEIAELKAGSRWYDICEWATTSWIEKEGLDKTEA